MTKPILTLPCKQNLNTLEELETGHYCKSCDKVLTDFRGKSGHEIMQMIIQSPEEICGIMHSTQINYQQSELIIPRYQSRIGLSLLGILGFLGPILSSCEGTKPDSPEIKITRRAFDNLKFPMTLRGVLRDHHSSDPLANSYVELIHKGKVIRKQKTNEKGEFSIRINKNELSDEQFELAYHSPNHFSDTIIEDNRLFYKEMLYLSIYAMPESIICKPKNKQNEFVIDYHPIMLGNFIAIPKKVSVEPPSRLPIQFDPKNIPVKEIPISIKSQNKTFK